MISEAIKQLRNMEIAIYIQSRDELHECLRELANHGMTLVWGAPEWRSGFIVFNKYMQRLLNGDDSTRTREVLKTEYKVEIVAYESLRRFRIRIPKPCFNQYKEGLICTQ